MKENKKNTGFYLLRICLPVLIVSLCLCGCSESRVYKYDKAQIDDITLNKSVYSDDKMVMYFDDLEDRNFKLGSCYGSDMNKLDSDFNMSISGGKVTIKGPGAGNISMLSFGNSMVSYRFRYLDTSQYALLTDTWAEDLGWETSGDEEAYFTSEEMARINATREENRKRQEESRRISEEIFNDFEGEYICPDDENMYVKIYLDDWDNKMIETYKPDRSGDVYTTSMCIDYAEYMEPDVDHSNSFIRVTEITYCTNELDIMYFEDKNTLYFEEDGPIFVRKGTEVAGGEASGEGTDGEEGAGETAGEGVPEGGYTVETVLEILGQEYEPPFHCDLDHTDENGDYVIHIYEIVDNETESHTATVDWITVNPQTGECVNFFGETFNIEDK